MLFIMNQKVRLSVWLGAALAEALAEAFTADIMVVESAYQFQLDVLVLLGRFSYKIILIPIIVSLRISHHTLDHMDTKFLRLLGATIS